MSASVSVVNQSAVVVVENTGNGSTAVVSAPAASSVAISAMGVRGPQGEQGPQGPTGPQGPAGSLEDGFVLDGGNF